MLLGPRSDEFGGAFPLSSDATERAVSARKWAALAASLHKLVFQAD